MRAASRLLVTPIFGRAQRSRSFTVWTDRSSWRAVDLASWPRAMRRRTSFSFPVNASKPSDIARPSKPSPPPGLGTVGPPRYPRSLWPGRVQRRAWCEMGMEVGSPRRSRAVKSVGLGRGRPASRTGADPRPKRRSRRERPLSLGRSSFPERPPGELGQRAQDVAEHAPLVAEQRDAGDHAGADGERAARARVLELVLRADLD